MADRSTSGGQEGPTGRTRLSLRRAPGNVVMQVPGDKGTATAASVWSSSRQESKQRVAITAANIESNKRLQILVTRLPENVIEMYTQKRKQDSLNQEIPPKRLAILAPPPVPVVSRGGKDLARLRQGWTGFSNKITNQSPGTFSGGSLQLKPKPNATAQASSQLKSVGFPSSQAITGTSMGITGQQGAQKKKLGSSSVQASGQDKLEEQTLKLFSLTDEKLAWYTMNPSLVHKFTKIQVICEPGTSFQRILDMTQFLEKCGHHFKSLFITDLGVSQTNFLMSLLRAACNIRKLDFRYTSQVQAYQLLIFLCLLEGQNELKLLNSLKLISTSGTLPLGQNHIFALLQLNTMFDMLDLGDALGPDVQTRTIEMLLNKQKNLVNLEIHGGFVHTTLLAQADKKIITFPAMKMLKSLKICASYRHASDSLKEFTTWHPIKFSVRFPAELKRLETLALGRPVEIMRLDFSIFRDLKQFHCGSHWNTSPRLPQILHRGALTTQCVVSLQFPDGMKDPHFVVQAAKLFPNLNTAWLTLPSASVLRAFFKAFENSKLERLFLTTQFDFESSLESCLLPEIWDSNKNFLSFETHDALQALKEYPYFKEYVQNFNVQLPVEEEDLLEGYSAGIRALKNLNTLWLANIPRKLYIPVPGEERRWDSPYCNFINWKEGTDSCYQLDARATQEVRLMKLQELHWVDVKVPDLGLVEGELFTNSMPMPENTLEGADTNSDCEKNPEGLFVMIKPSMLSASAVDRSSLEVLRSRSPESDVLDY